MTLVAVLFCTVAFATGDDAGADAAVTELDRLWGQGTNPEAVQRAVTVGTQAFEQHPTNYELAWRLARAYWRDGDLPADESQRRELYGTARRYAETAVKLDPSRVEGHCYYALTTGDYGGTLGLFAAVREGIASTFEREAQRAYEIDRDFDDGSPMLALGRYYFKLPWPKRDLDKSRRYLEELKQRHPDVLVGRRYLAETDRALGDEAAAQKELQYIAQAESRRRPGVR